MIEAQPPNPLEQTRSHGRKRIGGRQRPSDHSKPRVNPRWLTEADNSLMRNVALVLLALSLGWAVQNLGGVWPQKWAWSALGISLAACMVIVSGGLRRESAKPDAGIVLLGALLGWMIFQVVPLPPVWVALLSPKIWGIVKDVRAATGQDPNGWLPLSAAPSLTLERLLYVIPAMAAFVTMREIGAKPGRRMWKAVGAILAIATCESIVGLVQFSAGTPRVSGTYVNPNHFAGLLEMAFPLGVTWAAARWKRGSEHRTFPGRIVLEIGGLLGASVALMLAIFASLSRMAMTAMLVSLVVILAALLAPGRGRPQDSLGSDKRAMMSVLRWLFPVALPLIALLALAPVQAILRFAAPDQISGDGRLAIWRDTLRLIRAYPWTGCGLGAFERAFSQFRTYAPDNTVDYAHNDYLQILAELGWPGAVVVVVLAAWILWSVVSVVIGRRSARNWELAVGILGSIVAIGLHSLTDFNLYIPANALVLACLAGIGVSATVQAGCD